MGLLWTVLEPELAIINANLPLLRRLLVKCAPQLFSFTRSRGAAAAGGGSAGNRRTGSSRPTKFEKIHNDDGIFLQTIGGGFVGRRTECQGGVGATTSWVGARSSSKSRAGGHMGETTSTSATGIVRQIAISYGGGKSERRRGRGRPRDGARVGCCPLSLRTYLGT